MRRALAVGAGGTGALATGIVLAGVPALAATISFLPPILLATSYIAIMTMLGGLGNWKATRVMGPDGKILKVFRNDLEHMKLLGGEGSDPYRLVLKHSYGRQELTGEVARRALGTLLARVNRIGAPSGTVRDATGIIVSAGAPERAVAELARDAARYTAEFEERWRRWQRNPVGEQMREAARFTWRSEWSGRTSLTRLRNEPANLGALPNLPRAQRLALEMALHEDTEQRALEGELAILEAAWREAEEIAAIADEMFMPELTNTARGRSPGVQQRE